MELSQSDDFQPGELIRNVAITIGNVTLPANFWNDFKSTVGIDELHENHELLKKLTQFQHYGEFKRTSKLVWTYDNYNSMISLEGNEQGSYSYTCWAFSAASMIRNSCRVMIEDLNCIGVLDRLKNEDGDYVYDKCIKMINSSSFHVETRNAILMILVPRQLHIDDESQTAFLRAAVSRLANETIIDREGIFYLNRVASLVCDEADGLGLKDFPVNVTYKTYYNDHHPKYKSSLKPLIDEAIERKLCPVAAVDVAVIPSEAIGDGTHAMVLDTVADGKFIFKNTYAKNKQVEISFDKGPLEFYFLHIELTKEGFGELEKEQQLQIETYYSECDQSLIISGHQSELESSEWVSSGFGSNSSQSSELELKVSALDSKVLDLESKFSELGSKISEVDSKLSLILTKLNQFN